jgi:NADPH:quinone reductase-like Zn-dependent oxidoreductase/acyl carrier protein
MEMTFEQALVVGAEPTRVQLALREAGSGAWRLTVSEELAPSSWQVLASADIKYDARPQPTRSLAKVQAGYLAGVPVAGVPVAELYWTLSQMGLHYGAVFQTVKQLWRGDGCALGRIELSGLSESGAYQLHPALLDGCLQVGAAAWAKASRGPIVPVRIERVRLGASGGPLWCEAQARAWEAGVEIDLTLWDERGQWVGSIEGLKVAPLSRADASDPLWQSVLAVEWEAQEPPATKKKPGRWLVLADQGGLWKPIARHLEREGARVEVVHDVAADGAAGLAMLDAVDGILCLQGLDDRDLSWGRGWRGALDVAQAVIGRKLRDVPRLVLVTQRSQSLRGEGTRPEQALLWGLGGAVHAEQPDLRLLRIDVDDAVDAERVVKWALGDSDEDQVALRGDGSEVARLARAGRRPGAARQRLEPAGGRPYRLEVGEAGTLDGLQLVAMERREPQAGEVEVAVEAAGVNFLDVLSALGEIPNRSLGFECAGRVSRVGPGVAGVEVGQRVLALGAGMFATHAMVSSQLVLAIPEEWTSEQAAGLPVVHLTAYYSLCHVARLQRGERVLIHSAASGVGLAAVQWARHVGAEVLGTAGTEEKREWLRSQGVERVSDSRSERFVEEVLRWTEGEGVDVVLNSLSGTLLEKSFGLLRGGGRFVEIGKRDYLANHRVGLNPFLKGLSYTLVDLAGMVQRDTRGVRAVLEEVVSHVQSGVLQALPTQIAPLSKAPLWEMARGRHIGKFVVTVDADPRIAVASEGVRLRRDASYLVTGGLGGLGLTIGRWLAENGAGHVVLVGREAVATPAVEQMRAHARVSVVAADVADESRMREVLATLPDLRGVVHAAAVLDDALLAEQSKARFERVLRPKVMGAWNLHRLTKDLEFFVMYGSIASLLGSPGQANYSAANAFLDALAWHRRSQGMPALTLSWGAFSGVGLAAAQDNRGARLAGRGFGALSPEQGVELLAQLVDSEATHLAPCPLDVRQWLDFYPGLAGWPYVSKLLVEAAGAPAGDAAWLERLRSASPEEARELIQAHVLEQTARVLRMDAAALQPETPFKSLGLDSLMGLELRNRLQATCGQSFPATTVWTFPTPRALAGYLAARLGNGTDEAPAPVAPVLEVTEQLLIKELAELEEVLDA